MGLSLQISSARGLKRGQTQSPEPSDPETLHLRSKDPKISHMCVCVWVGVFHDEIEEVLLEIHWGLS